MGSDRADAELVDAGAALRARAEIARLYAMARASRWEVFFVTKRPPSAGDPVQFQTQWWLEQHGYYLPAVLTVPGIPR